MTKEIWINLPVKDVKKSTTFFTQIGFSQHPGPGNSADTVSFSIGSKGVIVMLIAEHLFKMFTRAEIADTKQGAEVLFSIDAESREEVDELVNKVRAAGGSIYAEAGENQGWMYGCGFADPDGHRWNSLYMDMSKMPKG